MLNFKATFDVNEYLNHHVTKNENVFLVKYDSVYSPRVRNEMHRINDKNQQLIKEGKKPLVLSVSVDIYYKPRSAKTNALMWTTYEFEANVMNKNKLGGTGVSSQELYENDLRKYAEKRVIRVKVKDVFTESAKQHEEYGHLFDVWPVSESEVDLVVYHTTSFFNSLEMSRWIDMRLDRLDAIDVPDDMTSQLDEVQGNLKDAKMEVMNQNDEIKEVTDKNDSVSIVEKMFSKPLESKAWSDMSSDEKRLSDSDRFFSESQIGLF